MLDRPEYGQRWARHWLDAVRFEKAMASNATSCDRILGGIEIGLYVR